MKQRILLTGKDGIDLLQRITTLDFGRLSSDLSQPGLILNPQGKILCYFEAFPTKIPNQLQITFEDSFLELLERYTFSERYEIEKVGVVEEVTDASRETKRIRARVPKAGNEFSNNGETNPLEVNLQDAIHDQKGCYPGQEVIEKVIAIGSPAKRLCLVKNKSEAPFTIDTLPMDLDFGKLTSYQHPFGLAIVRKTHTSSGTELRSASGVFEVIE